MTDLPALSLVVGGARSGKSGLAERLIKAATGPHHYIATAEAWDEEMRTRIAHHRADRGPHWITHEAPQDLAGPLAAIDQGVILLDCATLWLSNQMLAGRDVTAACAALPGLLAAHPCPVVVVSNEVGWGIVPDNALARAFRDHQGRLNQALAARAGLVITAIAGLALALKGELPQCLR